MGADGHVFIWPLALVVVRHRELHGRDLEDDWWYFAAGNLRAKLGGADYLVCYHEHGCDRQPLHVGALSEFGSRDMAEALEAKAAMERVNKTLDGLESVDVEVWT
jgi:hypothetical protein